MSHVCMLLLFDPPYFSPSYRRVCVIKVCFDRPLSSSSAPATINSHLQQVYSSDKNAVGINGLVLNLTFLGIMHDLGMRVV